MSILRNLFGPPDIKKMQQRGDMAGLLRALAYKRGDPEKARRLRRQAQEALISFGESVIEPAANLYLSERSQVDPRAIIFVLREIGRRAPDTSIRQRITEKFADLLDLRKGNRPQLLQGIYTLACQPNPSTYYALTRKIYTTWLEDPSPAIRLECALGMLVACLQARDFKAVERWTDQLSALSKESPEAAQRLAAALGEASPLLTDDYLRDKTVTLLLQIAARWPAHKGAHDMVVGSLKAYPASAVPELLEQLEAHPADLLAKDGLIAIGKSMKNSAQEATFSDWLKPFLHHRSWDTSFTIATVLEAIPWNFQEEQVKADALIARREFGLNFWGAVQINSDIVERMSEVADDERYPARMELVRHMASIVGQINDREARFRLRNILARELRTQPVQLHQYIFLGLSTVGWEPGKDASSAIYWLHKKDWKKAAEIGAAAVEPLITSLNAPDPMVRRGAARALSAIASQLAIDSATRSRIQAFEAVITEIIAQSADANLAGLRYLHDQPGPTQPPD